MILLIDNYDSFVYNLSNTLGRLGRRRLVVRNDQLSLAKIASMRPSGIILSPGPKAPKDAGICLSAIAALYKTIPLLGICLGHQCIGEAFGGQTVKAKRPMHGKASLIVHDQEGVFKDLPNPIRGARYHSLVTKLPNESILCQTAHVQGENTIMGLKHPYYPLYGLQFHPESILTDYGDNMLKNFLTLADKWNAAHYHSAV